MTESEKLLRRAGAVLVYANRHRVYMLGGQRFTLSRGSRENPRRLRQVRGVLRSLGMMGG